jgi:hypothetical protein
MEWGSLGPSFIVNRIKKRTLGKREEVIESERN